MGFACGSPDDVQPEQQQIMFDRWYLVAPLAAFLIGACAFPAVRWIALAVGFVDNPDRWRKLHQAPIPLGGGIALWLATWSAWGLGRLGGAAETAAGGEAGWFAVALAITTLVTLAAGLVDDRYQIRARHKLAGQLLAAVVLVGLGPRLGAWSAFGVELKLGHLAYPVAVCWVVLVVNAFNLVDGMDGFCGSLGLVAALGIAFLGYRSGHTGDALLALALAGALLAFLSVNLPPASVYLGDAGSMTLGLMIAALSLRACSDGPGTAVSLPCLVAVLTLPLLDVVTAVGRRLLTGHSVFAPDREHIHHCLSRRLGSTNAVLAAAVGLATLGVAGAALAKVYRLGDLVACLAVGISVGLLVATDTFVSFELRLLLLRVRTILTPRPVERFDEEVSGARSTSAASGTGRA
jgi:UDP-GlcNAc:undecaprenyl-phosphate GlcNAc-1-phosphate transferase